MSRRTAVMCRRTAVMAIRNFGRKNRATKFRIFHNFAAKPVETL